MAKERKIRTVLGDIPPAALGFTHTHEHLISDLSAILDRPELLGRLQKLGWDEMPARFRQKVNEPISLENYDWIKRHGLNRDNLTLLDEDTAIAELSLYKRAGGGAVVDSTPIGMARDPEGLARISRATGVHVIMGSGYYVAEYQPPTVQNMTVGDITERIVKDIEEGIGPERIRSGIIGEIGLSWPVHPVEEKVLAGAVAAQKMTGAALQIHPGRHREAAMDAVRRVEALGGNVDRTIICHIDRTLFNIEDMLELARTGCYLEFDLFGREHSYYSLEPSVEMPNDAMRINYIMQLCDAGFSRKILCAQDICTKVYLRRYGGPGYAHILENVVPQMLRKGMSRDLISTIFHHNPAEILAFA